MKRLLVLLIITILLINFVFSQSGISVNTIGTPDDNSAILDVSSTSQGLLIPRMTTVQRDAISSPALSLLIFNITTNCFEAYVNGVWYSISCSSSRPALALCSMSRPADGFNGCGDEFSYFGQTYKTVLIGSQCWMAENLNIGKQVKEFMGVNQPDNDTIVKWCYWNSTDSCNIFGGLYQWNEAMCNSTSEGSQGICPNGWHIPDKSEWIILINYLGGESIAGGKMKENGLSHWHAPNTGATNSSGFTALPGGNRAHDSSFNNVTFTGTWWSSTEDSSIGAYDLSVQYITSLTLSGDGHKLSGMSVRCIKN
jgi:uncharacterized protein (TIGR02145 family)